jgi:aryl-alcohol dehydrogenase-like predicted oxidoreductase
MEFKTIAGTDLNVSVVGIGCNNFGMRSDKSKSEEVIHAALDEGINFFDTADIYGGRGKSEEILGSVLSGMDRSKVLIATKFANPMSDDETMRGASRDYIMQAVEASLKRLQTDYIDLYQQHVPDPRTPIEETLRALEDLVQQGKVRHIGNSNFAGWQITDADWTASSNKLTRFVTAQNLYSLLDRRIEREIVPACKRFDIGILPYFPLASGMLTGKYTRGEAPPEGTRMAAFGDRGKRAMSDENFDKVEKLTTFAEDNGHTILELAMSWLACLPYVPSVIAGATSAEQVKQNAAAVSWQLSAEEMAAVDGLSK